jgi:hypothetical protein
MFLHHLPPRGSRLDDRKGPQPFETHTRQHLPCPLLKILTFAPVEMVQGTGEAQTMAMLKELEERVKLTEGAVKAGLSGVVKLASAVRLRRDRDAELQGTWR